MRAKGLASLVAAVVTLGAGAAVAQGPERSGPVHLRFRVLEPERRFVARIGGWGASWIHVSPWAVAKALVPADRKTWGDVNNWVQPNTWTDWVDLSDRKWHGRLNREGGVAEWPALGIQLRGNDETGKVQADADNFRAANANYPGEVRIEVQLATAPNEAAVLKTFIEEGAAGQIGFLLPTPLDKHLDEFETGRQMTERHRAWATEVTGGEPVALEQMSVATSIWGHYDPELCREEIETLKLLGFNTVNDGRWPEVLREAAVSPFWQTGFEPDPELQEWHWHKFVTGLENQFAADPESRWRFDNTRWVTISDEIKVLDLRQVAPARLNREFQGFLGRHKVEPAALGFEQMGRVKFPLDPIYEQKRSPRDADLQERRLFYWAARFGQWWSVKQLRQKSDLIRKAFPGARTHTLPTDHGFLNAWGPPYIGMSYRLLDLFELGRQQAVDYIGAEDWLGLNHMYGPGSTWTGAQTFEYFTAIARAGVERPDQQEVVAWIMPSDEGFLRLKAFAALAQGAKHFYFWTYGPTFISTENYWSDLKSEYVGIAEVLRDVAQVEEALYAAQVVRDPVAILYSVSHDIWHPDDPACFVEKRLLWHALRHLGIQPEFLAEEDIAAGRLADYQALFMTDQCVSKAAAGAIEAWVKAGGVLYASAGAAGRDEFYEPSSALAFCQGVWPAEPEEFARERHAYNERVDLPGLEPMSQATVKLPGAADETKLPVLGYKHDIRPDQGEIIGHFDDGNIAAVVRRHERGRVIYLGFLPMLAYGQMAGFKPTTLEEKWPAAPREIVAYALREAGITPTVRTDAPVVEATLLTGPKGSVVVIANFTYEPIDRLTVTVRLPDEAKTARSVEHGDLALEAVPGGARFSLPLDWTDLVVLQ